jgi:hypothetical protein
MMQLLNRWRLSRCHDDGRTPPASLRDRAARSEPLDRYARALDVIDRELSESAPIAQPPAQLIRRTLEKVSEIPATTVTPARASLWPVLSSLTVAAVALMLFVARPWSSRSFSPAQPLTQGHGARAIGVPDPIAIDLHLDDATTRQAAALVEESRAFAQSVLRDALPFATGAGR